MDQYFEYDRECLLDPEPNVTHYEVMLAHDFVSQSQSGRQ
jgi:hypothetical protein